jgi:hypothetical protein
MQPAPRQRHQKCRCKSQRRGRICRDGRRSAVVETSLRPLFPQALLNTRRNQNEYRRDQRRKHHDPQQRIRRRAMPFQECPCSAERREPVEVRRKPRRNHDRQRQRRHALKPAARERHRSQHLRDRFHVPTTYLTNAPPSGLRRVDLHAGFFRPLVFRVPHPRPPRRTRVGPSFCPLSRFVQPAAI